VIKVGLANAVDTQLAIVQETTWGVTPTTPVFKKTRITGESLVAGLTTVQSQELRPDRNISDLPLVAAAAAGGFNFELSYSTFDDLLASALFGNWSGNSLTNGQSANMKSFTVEKRFDMGGGLYEYFRYRGMVPNTVTLNLGVDAIITGAVDFIGKSEDVASSLISGATYVDATTNPVLNATRDFAMFSIGGNVNNYVSSISISIANNLRSQRAVAHLEGIGVGTGSFTVTGSMTVYFRDRSVYEKYLNNESVSLSFILGEEGGKQYKFTLPSIKFSSGQVLAENQGADLMCNMQYQALFSSQINGTLRIERAVGAPPSAVVPTGVVLDMPAMTLVVGNSGTIIATVLPDNATDKTIIWSTGDSAVATVANGVVTAIAAGTTTITATTSTGSLTATCAVTVV
jgi:hypothetical protein